MSADVWEMEADKVTKSPAWGGFVRSLLEKAVEEQGGRFPVALRGGGKPLMLPRSPRGSVVRISDSLSSERALLSCRPRVLARRWHPAPGRITADVKASRGEKGLLRKLSHANTKR